jgi:hypothetical protein
VNELEAERTNRVDNNGPGPAPRQRKSNLISNLFAVAAIAFALLAAVLYARGSGGIAPIPTAAPGGNQIINVTEALEAQGLTIAQPRGLFIPRGKLDAPGQGVEIDGNPGFIFLYPIAEAAQADVAAVAPDTIVPARLAGTPAPSGERRITHGSNVAVVMIGGDPAIWQKVEDAVASLS